MRFTDVTRPAGIDFVHHHGGSGRKYLPETMGAGGGVLDYDGDGLDDLFLVQSAPLPGTPPDPQLRNALYRNEGNGRFTDVTLAARARGRGYGMGFCSGDVDNDGDADIYVSEFGENLLLVNRGDGTFEDATATAGVGDRGFGASCALADVDGDGALDLYVTNYLDYTIAKDKPCGNVSLGLHSYCHPDVYDGVSSVYYHNNGDGTFTDATREAGLYQPEGKGLGVVFGDFDGDGDEDLYQANDSVASFLFRNDGEGRFEEIALFAGAAYNENGESQAGMGVDAADVDGDGDWDLFKTHLAMETNILYRNRGNGTFEDDTYASGLGEPSLLFVGFGTKFLDFDRDGDADLFVANGHIEDDAEQYNRSITYRERAHLYANDGSGRFREEGARHGEFFLTEGVARGAATLDLEGDGDLDLLVTYCNDRPKILRSDGGPARHWLEVRVLGRVSNRDGIGATLALTSGGLRQIREIRTGTSYLSQSSLTAHFGLGAATVADRLDVRWPSGRTQSFENVTADRRILVDEVEGIR